MKHKTKDFILIIAELAIVTLIVLFVLNIEKFFPSPPMPESNIAPIANITVVQGAVTVTEFSDFECPFCARAAIIVRQLQNEYSGRVNFAFKHFPVHQDSEKAAEAAECAKDQGKFWEYHDMLFQNQQSLDVVSLKKYAEDLGLNQAQFNSCLDSGEKAQIVRQDFQQGVNLGVQGTPTFFVNDKTIVGAQPVSDFEQVINDELAKSNK